MSVSRNTFSFRLNAEGAEQVVGAFRKVAGQSDELRAAYERLIQSSPQLASVHDGVQAKLRDTAAAMRRTGAESESLAASLGRGGAMGLALGAGAALFETLVEKVKAAYEAIPKAGDAARQTVARFAALGGSAEIAAQSYERLAAISRTTGAGLQQTADSFASFTIAAKDLGATQDQVLRVIEGVQKFGVVSGAAPQAMASATQQLGQALASGRLQGDELRSIMENLPLLAQALAKELGVSVGQLRQMGSEGKLTGVEVFQALERAAGTIDEKFKGVPMSLERAGNAAETAVSQMLARVDQLVGLSAAAAASWERIARYADAVRQFLGGATQAETVAALETERRALEAERNRIQADRAQAAAAGIGQLGGFDASQRAQQIEARLAAIREQQRGIAQDQRELRAADREAALQAGREGARANLTATRDKLLEMDPVFKAKKERDEALKDLDQVFRTLGLTREEYDRTATAINDRYAKALEAANGKERESIDSIEALLEARRKVDEQGRAAELAIDRQAAAYERTTQQVQALIEAMALYEESSGARGIRPDRAQELIARTQQDLIDNWDKLGGAVEKTDNTFNQFFSNATSKFEDAITRGAKLREIIAGIGQDIARLIIRKSITDPLSNAAGDLFKGVGGFSGIGDFLKGLFGSGGSTTPIMGATQNFAMGGIMTSAGPLPLNRYAGGGIADSPQLALFGEGRQPEAYVPLPDGRSIPVTMRGGGTIQTGDVIVNVTNSNASPQQIAAAVQTAVDRSHRELVAEINRGGAMAKVVGRRR